MRRRTLTLRLIAASAIWIVGTLCAAGLLLLLLFQDHIERRFDAALADHLQELAAASEVGPDGSLQLSWTPFDPRFNRPQSGWYWQIEQGDAIVERSRSPGRALRPGPASADEAYQEPGRRANGCAQSSRRSRCLERPAVSSIRSPARPSSIRTCAVGTKLALTLAVLALGLVGAVVAQVHYGLLPLKRMRLALAHVRSGAATRLPETFPGEVQPLVHELNALLDHNADLLERARTQTGNLAHALKNPLTVSAARRARSRHRTAPCCASRPTSWPGRSSGISRGRARQVPTACSARGRGGVWQDLQFSLERLYRERAMEIELRDLNACPRAMPGPRGCSRLMDNACKWAAASGSVAPSAPGCGSRSRTTARGSPAMRGVMLRGQRLDETTAGAGLGLAIVRDLAELYRGSLELTRSSLGGLCATLDLPAAAPTAGSGPAIDVPLPVGR
jgi:signal transduction histidine kinase